MLSNHILNDKHVFRWKIFVTSWMFGLCATRSSRMLAHCFMQTEVPCSWCRENGWKKTQSQPPKNLPPHFHASPVLTSTTTFDLLAASVLRNTRPDPCQKLVSIGSLSWQSFRKVKEQQKTLNIQLENYKIKTQLL